MREQPKNILIAGAGFGGLTAARILAKKLPASYQTILIDKNDFHLFTPALYEIAAMPRHEASAIAMKPSAALPLTTLIAGRSIHFIQGELVALDQTMQTVTLRDGTLLPYAALILALGSESEYFAIPGLAQYAHPCKRFEDAVRIRNAVERILTAQHHATIVIGGAGPTGVELAAEFSNFLCYLEKQDARRNVCVHQLILVEAANDILPGLDERTVAHARKRLHALEIQVKTAARITQVTQTHIELKNQPSIRYDLFIWTGGVAASATLKKLGLALSEPKHAAAVNQFLQVTENIYAIGDAMRFPGAKPLPSNVPAAQAAARACATNILRAIAGQPLIAFQPPPRYPFVLALGRKNAVANLVFFSCSGLAGWMIKLAIELHYFLTILSVPTALALWRRNIKLYRAND